VVHLVPCQLVNVSEAHSTFIFSVKQTSWSAYRRQWTPLQFFDMSVTVYQFTWCNIPEVLNFQKHCRELQEGNCSLLGEMRAVGWLIIFNIMDTRSKVVYSKTTYDYVCVLVCQERV
jgi:hypothetical protein